MICESHTDNLPTVHGRTGWTNSRRPSRVSIPARAHPHAKLVFAEMARQGVTYGEIEHRSGVLVSTVKAWRNGNSPGLASLAATLGALGWAYVPVPRKEALPAWLAAELDNLNERWGCEEPVLHHLLASACLAPILVEGAA